MPRTLQTHAPHAPQRVLALDLATTTGFALLGGGVVTSGSQCFARYGGSKRRKADHYGEPFAQFHRWLAEKIRTDKPETIAYEEVCRWQGYSAAHCFGAYRGHMLALAAGHNLPCVGYSPTAIKRFWTGKGNADKDAMVAAARVRCPGVDLTDANEADALAILHLHVSSPERRILCQLTPFSRLRPTTAPCASSRIKLCATYLTMGPRTGSGSMK